jgi:hypothetical protein
MLKRRKDAPPYTIAATTTMMDTREFEKIKNDPERLAIVEMVDVIHEALIKYVNEQFDPMESDAIEMMALMGGAGVVFSGSLSLSFLQHFFPDVHEEVFDKYHELLTSRLNAFNLPRTREYLLKSARLLVESHLNQETPPDDYRLPDNVAAQRAVHDLFRSLGIKTDKDHR